MGVGADAGTGGAVWARGSAGTVAGAGGAVRGVLGRGTGNSQTGRVGPGPEFAVRFQTRKRTDTFYSSGVAV